MTRSTQVLTNQAHQIFDAVKKYPHEEMFPQLLQAKEYYSHVLQTDPSSNAAKLPLIEILIWLDDLVLAKSLCEEISSENKFFFDATLLKIFINIQMGKLKSALADLEVMRKINPYSSILPRLEAMCYFQLEDIPKGWIRANEAFNYKQLKVRYPNLTSWKGEDIGDKTLVLTMLDIRGGGDEVMFASILNEVIKKTKKCFIETEERAYDLFVQSFPNAIVFGKGQQPWLEDNTKVDFHCWVRELTPYLYRDRCDFPKKSQYLNLDSKNLEYWVNIIKKIKNKKYTIGICWRSLHSVGPNRPMCTSIMDWEPVFKIPNIDFINLHDLDGSEEVKTAEKMFGVKIHSIDEADLRHKFDHVAGIAKACDAVITVPSTASILARAIGANVFHLQSEYTALCMDILPWFPDQNLYTRRWDESWHRPIQEIARDLKSTLM